MPRSVGEAAALGLESGYRMATDAKDRARREEREARLDAEHREQQTYTRGRQEQADTIGALDAQAKALGAEGLAGHATPEAQEAYTRRVEGLNMRRNQVLAKASGYNPAADEEAAVIDIKKLQAGQVEGVNLKRASAAATGRPHTDYVRQNGQPSVVEQAGEDFMTGMEKKDEKTMLRGVNVMYAPQLRKGVGTKSPHGTIVAKEVVGLDLDPRSPPDDPHFVPRLRVYVNTGKELRGPLPEGVPPGATGYYDAPMTKNRSSDPEDHVQSIGLQQAMDFMHLQGQWVEVMNGPEAQAKLQQEANQPGYDEDRYLRAKFSVGAAGGKKDSTISYHGIPQGGLIKATTDARGNVVSEERIEATAKPTSGADPLQKKIDAIRRLATEEGGNIFTEAEAVAKIKALTEKESTRAPRGSGGGGSGGGGKGGNLQSTKVDNEGYVVGVYRDGASKRLLIDGKPWKSQDFEKRVDKVAHDMSKGIGGLGKTPDAIRKEARAALLNTAEPEEKKPASPKKLDKLPDGAKQIGTAGGKPVYEVTNPDGTKRRFKGE